MSLFEGSGLSCVRGERMVFAGVSFAVAAGEALLMTGPNGSGKSSLLRLAAGLLRPAEGRILWAGRPISDDPEAHRARLCYVGHQDPVKPVLSVRENLAFWSRLRGRHARVDEALERFGLAALAVIPGRFLSAGQRRRLNLARLLVAPAQLWLLDEPTVGLDAEALKALEAALATQRAQGGVVMLATHTPLDIPGARTLDLSGAVLAEALAVVS
ncbi:MAG TPA: heme ABC exporter ATP-binding protein CcmA [Alphaproteobacteria bacterium]|nr:heme ABC exporter ATP-binding protein CcmA [Alphaproteobacteria bacterium]